MPISRSLLLLFSLSFAFSSSCRRPVEEGGVAPATQEPAEPVIALQVRHIDAAAAADLIDSSEGLAILDVRTPEEFAEGHLQNAINIDFKAEGFREALAQLDPKKTYLLHCRSGNRSGQSLPIFEELGFISIDHLEGGFNAWREAGNAYVTE